MIELINCLAGVWEMAMAVLDKSGSLEKVLEGDVPLGVKGVQARHTAVDVALGQIIRALSGLRRGFGDAMQE